MKLQRLTITTIIIFIIGIFWGYSQDTGRIIYKGILSPSLATTICKDSIGFIWIGTSGGIKKYGEESEYRFPVKDPLFWDGINALIEIPGNKMMAGNKRGLWVFDKQKQELAQAYIDEIKFPVLSLMNDQKKFVYIGTTNGLYCLDPGNNELKQVVSGIMLETILLPIIYISIDNQGVIWLLTSQNIISYNPRNKSTKPYQPRTKYSMVCAMNADEKIYIGTEEGKILAFDLNKHIFAEVADIKKNITCLVKYDSDVLIAGTKESGIYFISPSTSRITNILQHNLHDKNSISSNAITTLFVDEFNNILVGYYSYVGLDVLKYKAPLFKVYSHGHFSSQDIPVRSFYIDKQGLKLIGTRDSLYYIDEKRNLVKFYKKEDGLRSNIIFSITKYNNKYFIGTCKGGLSVLDPETYKISTLGDFSQLLDGDIFAFYHDHHSRLWITSTNGIHCYDKADNSLKSYTDTNSGLLDNFILYIYEDSRKRVWIGTSKGVCILDPDSGKFSPVTIVNSFIGNEGIRSVFEDKKGNLYFGTTINRKLLCLNKDLTKCRYIEETSEGTVFKQSSFFETPWNGIVDNNGNMWMISQIGIMQADQNMKNWKLYTQKDGLPDDLIVDATKCFKDWNGTLWFADTKGLIYVDAIPQISTLSERKLYIDYIKSNGVTFLNEGKDHDMILSRSKNNVSIHFMSLNYEWNQEHAVYEYKLEGFDQQWNRVAGNKEIDYTNLHGGKYTFYVREFMNPNSTQKLNFEIKSSFTYYGYIVVILIVFAIALFVVYKKRNQKKEDDKQSGENKPEEKYKNIKISEFKANEIINKLTTYLDSEKPYTDPNLKIHDLATAIGCSTPILSQIFNQYLNARFYDYMAKYRVEEFKRLIGLPEYAHYTLTALGEKSGFNSQASFFRSFKKITGITPNEYIKAKEK